MLNETHISFHTTGYNDATQTQNRFMFLNVITIAIMIDDIKLLMATYHNTCLLQSSATTEEMLRKQLAVSNGLLT